MRFSTLATFGACLLATLVTASPDPLNGLTSRPGSVGDLNKRESKIAAGSLHERQDDDYGGDDAGAARKREAKIVAESLHKRKDNDDDDGGGDDDSGDDAGAARKREAKIAAESLHRRKDADE